MDRDGALRPRLRALAEQYPPCGYPILTAMLCQEGLVKNPRTTYRLYTEERLGRTKRRKNFLTQGGMERFF